MLNRRITAVLLTAFLVAELLWRWQGGIAQPATSPSNWTQVTQGAYRIAGGGFLVPYGAGSVLRRTAFGIVRARPEWSAHLRGIDLAIYGSGAGQIGVAQCADTTELLPRRGTGYLLLDTAQNLWQIGPRSVSLLLGGQAGDASRAVLAGRVASLKLEGSVPPAWQLVWASDPMPVGQSIWYLSNRDGVLGVTPPHVWQLDLKGDESVPALIPLGNLDLIAASANGVLASDVMGSILSINPQTGFVRRRIASSLPIEAGPQGQLLLARGDAIRSGDLVLADAGLQHLKAITIPEGLRPLGPARFSADGNWLALLCARREEPVVFVVRARGTGAGRIGVLIGPPAGARIVTAEAPSLDSGHVYLVVRTGRTVETWSRSIGSAQTAAGSAQDVALAR